VLAYLSRYTHRVAISNRRLVAADDEGVSLRWKDYRIEGPGGTKASWSAPSPRYGRSTSGRSAQSSRSQTASAIWRCSIWQSTASCAVAMSVALKVEDIAPHGYAVERATVRQKKTGVPVRFEVTEHTRQAVDDYIRAGTESPGVPAGVRYLSKSCRRRASCLAASNGPKFGGPEAIRILFSDLPYCVRIRGIRRIV
jgi:Putative transposase